LAIRFSGSSPQCFTTRCATPISSNVPRRTTGPRAVSLRGSFGRLVERNFFAPSRIDKAPDPETAIAPRSRNIRCAADAGDRPNAPLADAYCNPPEKFP
jgi:hypothetical protein